ncbi:MAG: hypothetical protein K8S98_10525 [Planctomycetes bacterium]|nr:hypothetical protein [Planctomycetota bacterium]
MGARERREGFRELVRRRVARGAVRTRVVLRFLAVAEPQQHAQTVGLEREHRLDAAEEQDLLRARFADGREALQDASRRRAAAAQRAREVADVERELRAFVQSLGALRRVDPAERRDFEQHVDARRGDGTRVEADALLERRERLGAPLVVDQVRDVLPQRERERLADLRLRDGAVEHFELGQHPLQLRTRHRGENSARSRVIVRAVTDADSTPKPRRAWPIEPTRWPTREAVAASRLFSPARLGALETRTRTWVPAMVPWRASDEGFVTPDVLDWYRRFADGEPGVLVVEATGIRDVPSGPLLRIGHPRFEAGLAELVATVREHSRGRTRLFVQLIDFLAVKRRPEKAKFLERFLVLRDEHRERLAAIDGRAVHANDAEVRELLARFPHPTLLALLDLREREDLEYGYRERVTDTHLAQIAELPRVLPRLFADAAARAKAVGFDGVELHFAHAYTLASFLSRTNTRADGYGGSLEHRARLPLEVFRAVRASVGSDYVVGCRYLGDEVIDGGSRVDDACFFGREFARAGFDFLSISKGGKFDDAKQPKVGEAVYPYTGPSGHECMPTVRIDEPQARDARGPFGRNLPLARAVREDVRAAGGDTPIVGSGGVNSFELAERALVEGDCDFVAAARQSLADPDWWKKVEQGRGDEVRRCKFTNYCEALDQRHAQVTCQLWDHDFATPDAGKGTSGEEPRRSSDAKRRLNAPPWKES